MRQVFLWPAADIWTSSVRLSETKTSVSIAVEMVCCHWPVLVGRAGRLPLPQLATGNW